MTEADDSQLASATASDCAPVIRALLNHGLMVSVPDPQPDPKMDLRGTALRRRTRRAKQGWWSLTIWRTVVGGLSDGRPRTSQLDKAFGAEGRLLLVGPLRGGLSAERR